MPNISTDSKRALTGLLRSYKKSGGVYSAEEQKIFEAIVSSANNDSKLERGEVIALAQRHAADFEVFKDGLEYLLNRVKRGYSNIFTDDGLAKAQEYLQLAPTPAPGPTPTTTPTDASGKSQQAATVTDLSKLLGTLRLEFEARKNEFSVSGSEKKLVAFFSDYAAQFLTLKDALIKKDLWSYDYDNQIQPLRSELLAWANAAPKNQLLKKDQIGKGLSLAVDLLWGTDPLKHDSNNDGISDAQSIRGDKIDPMQDYAQLLAPDCYHDSVYYPLAGNDSKPGDFSGSGHPWSAGSFADIHDQIDKKRGGKGEALAKERLPYFNHLVGKENGSYIPQGTIKEADAEMSLGVDFNGDGVCTAGVTHDFADAWGNFNKDGKTTGSIAVDWFGRCHNVAFVNVIAAQPRSAAVDGVNISVDVGKEALVLAADVVQKNTVFLGDRNDGAPDVLVYKENGQSKTLQGFIVSQHNWYEARKDDRHGDSFTLRNVKGDVTLRDEAGNMKTVKAADVVSITYEEKSDFYVGTLHTALLNRLGLKHRGFVVDTDQGAHVWSKYGHKCPLSIKRNVDPATLKGNPSQLTGQDPTVTAGEEIQLVSGSLSIDTYGSKTLQYWLKLKDGRIVDGGPMQPYKDSLPDFMWWAEADWSNLKSGVNPNNRGMSNKLTYDVVSAAGSIPATAVV